MAAESRLTRVPLVCYKRSQRPTTRARFGRLGYHVRRGTHNLTTYDWMRFLDFAETLWR